MDTQRVPIIDRDVCTFCGVCAALCPAHVVVIGAQGPALASPEACTYCGLCEEICPVGAIALLYTIVWDTEISLTS